MYKYEIRAWDATTGRVRGRVLISSYSSSVDTTVFIAFNDNGITTFQGDVAGMYTTATNTDVFPLSDGSSIDVTEKCGTGLTLAAGGSPLSAATHGLFEGGATFVAANSNGWVCSTASSLEVGTTFTISVYYKPTTLTDNYHMIACNGNPSQRNFSLYTNQSSSKPEFAFTHGVGVFTGVNFGTVMTNGVRARLDVTYDNTTLRAYTNGVADGTTTVTATPDVIGGSQFWLGRYQIITTGDPLYANGEIEQFVIAKGVARSADYLLTTYRLDTANGTYVSIA
jgi:hypothetical protein